MNLVARRPDEFGATSSRQDAGAVNSYDLALIRTANFAVQPRKHTRRPPLRERVENPWRTRPDIGGEYFSVMVPSWGRGLGGGG